MFGRRLFTFCCVLLAHAAAIGGLSLARVIVPESTPPIVVAVITTQHAPVDVRLPRVATARLVEYRLADVLSPAPTIVIDDGDEVAQQSSAAPIAVSPASNDVQTFDLEVQCPQRAPPAYPPLARRLREQGEVRLRVEIDVQGNIESVAIVNSSGSPRLDAAAQAAIQTWRCKPAERDGRKVRAVAEQTLAFVLAKRDAPGSTKTMGSTDEDDYHGRRRIDGAATDNARDGR